MSEKEIILFPVIEKLAEYITTLIHQKIAGIGEGDYFSIALSGGSTPKRIFEYMARHETGNTDWNKVRFFWGDERCVPPDNEESNFRMARLNLFEKLKVPQENIFRILGENNPEKESIRYSNVIAGNVRLNEGLPQFDLVLLGLGEDGHTASIFPGHTGLFQSTNYCEAVINPHTGQQRITITGQIINNANNVVFIVTGKTKARIAATILLNGTDTGLPASFVNPVHGQLFWLLDNEAAELIVSHPDLKINTTS